MLEKVRKEISYLRVELKDKDPSIFPFGTYTEEKLFFTKEPQADNHWSCANRVVYTSDDGVGGKNKEKYRLYDDENLEMADPIDEKQDKKASQGCGEYQDYEKHLASKNTSKAYW